MALRGDTLYVLTSSSLLQRLDLSEPGHPRLRTQDFLSDNSMMIRLLGDTMVVYQPQRGFIAFRDQGKGLQPTAGFPFKGNVTDITVAENKLYATVENDGVYILALGDKDFRLLAHYPLLSRATCVNFHNGTLYFSGESSITALTPLPDLVTEQTSADHMTVKFPPYVPLGSYNMVLTDNDGDTVVDANALQVAMPRFSRPKITQEEFERLLQEHRAKNQGQSPSAQ